ncbi:hypothetical protein [Butyrivibrio sp. AE2032]|uniref:hypothetical protein n=1 Tax=Butyrivibrio sp. AE2032 TaxID=1458463 RepID=UPI00163A0FA4|nr:hypothetical protein [Butyrivibrio sp. AE2032]
MDESLKRQIHEECRIRNRSEGTCKQFDKKRREAQTKGQVTHKCDLLFCSGLHRLFTKEYNYFYKLECSDYNSTKDLISFSRRRNTFATK